jgi:hypothetical protein
MLPIYLLFEVRWSSGGHCWGGKKKGMRDFRLKYEKQRLLMRPRNIWEDNIKVSFEDCFVKPWTGRTGRYF